MESDMRVHKSIAALEIKGERKNNIIKAFKEQAKKRLFPNKENALLLINEYNECTGYEEIKMQDYSSCNDCRLRVFKFWKSIVDKWEKTK